MIIARCLIEQSTVRIFLRRISNYLIELGAVRSLSVELRVV